MTLQEAEQVLDEFLKEKTTTLGFRHVGRLEYARQVEEAIALLSWPCRLDPCGFAAFTCWVGLRFECLAMWLADRTDKMVATVATPIHFLREDTSFTEWKFFTPDDLEQLRGPILSDINGAMRRFIERYS